MFIIGCVTLHILNGNDGIVHDYDDGRHALKISLHGWFSWMHSRLLPLNVFAVTPLGSKYQAALEDIMVGPGCWMLARDQHSTQEVQTVPIATGHPWPSWMTWSSNPKMTLVFDSYHGYTAQLQPALWWPKGLGPPKARRESSVTGAPCLLRRRASPPVMGPVSAPSAVQGSRGPQPAP